MKTYDYRTSGDFDQHEEDVAYELIHECYEVEPFLDSYIDYEAIGLDLRHDGYYDTGNGTVLECCY